jgi:hypothetical protein
LQQGDTLMSVDIGPPQVSPDGKWVWDGQKWLPLPAEGTTASPFEAASIPYVAPSAAAEPQPAPVAYVYTPPEPAIRPWEQPARSGPSVYSFAALGAVGLILVLVLLNVTNIISIPWPGTSSGPTVTMVHGSPKPLVSDYVLADHFLSLSLGPAIVSLDNTLPAVKASCGAGATLSNACHDAVLATNDQMANVLSVIDHAGIPACIAYGVKALRTDLQDMAGGIGVALHGFQDSSADEVNTGIYHFAVVAQSLQSDGAGIDTEAAACPQVIPS